MKVDIYYIKSPSDKGYIGQTRQYLSKDETNNIEYEMIKEYNTLHPNGYNLRTGGKKLSIIKTFIKRKT